LIGPEQAESVALDAWDRRTEFNGEPPRWYEEKLAEEESADSSED